jgi:hypothetical protein
MNKHRDLSTDLSAEARSAKVEARSAKVDAAIDRTAARMVAVPDDPEMVARIIGALPERSSRRGWLIPQFAALGAIVIAAVVWSTRERPASPAVLPSTEIAPATALPGVITPREPGTAFRTLPSEHPEPSEPLPLSSDFERSLPSLEIADTLMVSDVTPTELPASPALELAPIGVPDLPLTAESFPPR